MKTVVKFYENTSKKNPIITRTLGKIGVPTEEVSLGFWIVDVDKESHPKQSRGVFFLDPIEKIEEEDLISLVPTLFTTKYQDGICYVKPKIIETFYILPIKVKRKLMDIYNAYGVIVVVEEPNIFLN